jgi:hypothetical protein
MKDETKETRGRKKKHLHEEDYIFLKKLSKVADNEFEINAVIRAEVEKRYKKELKIADDRWKRAEQELREV